MATSPRSYRYAMLLMSDLWNQFQEAKTVEEQKRLREDMHAIETASAFGRLDRLILPSVRAVVLARANHCCQRCKQPSTIVGKLDMHHIRYMDSRGESIRGGRETPEDLRAVCRNCHKQIHGH